MREPTYNLGICPICGAAILPVAPAQYGASVVEYECGTRLRVSMEVLSVCVEKEAE